METEMETGTENRRVLFEVEVLGRSHGRRCFVCDSPAWPMHTVRPRGGDYGRYACFAHVSEVMVTWDDQEEDREESSGKSGEVRDDALRRETAAP